MNLKIHLICAAVLLFSHVLFLIRSFFLLKNQRSPGRGDRILLQVSQLMLPLGILTGFFASGSSGSFPFFHALLGLSPLILMVVIRKKSFRRKHPWVLPVFNGILLAGAFLSGIFLN